MSLAKDGYVVFGETGAGKCRYCLSRFSRRPALLSVSVLLITSFVAIPETLGRSSPVSPPVMSTACVVARQAMTMLDASTPPPPASENLTAANRPISLESDVPAPDTLADLDPMGDGPVVQSDSALVEGPSYPESDGGSIQDDSGGSIVLAGLQQPAPPKSPAVNPANFGDSIIGSITFEAEKARQITVVKNFTATINLKEPIDRAEIKNPQLADVIVPTPQQIIVVGKSTGTTQLILWKGEEQLVFNVAVELDLALLNNMIKTISPTSNVEARSLNGRIILRGSVPDAATADQIVDLAKVMTDKEEKPQNHMRIAGVQQTMLRVVVAEVNREALRQLGMNWAIGGSNWSRDFFFANNLSQLTPTVFGSSGLANVLLSPQNGGQLTYSVAPVGNAATNVTFGFPRAEFQLFLNALRENSLARTLAEPNLVAISGQTATFLAGGEVPIPVAQAGSSTGAVTIEYREFGVRLGFTPTVTAGQIIRLHVMTEISEAVPTQQLAGGFPIFTFNTRRVESTIECGNGQTFAIAGLLSEEVRSVASKIPGLGDIPILGTLFSSTSYQKSNTEMVILVTPQLVEPLDPQQIPPPPGTLLTDPTDYQLFALQKLTGPQKVVPDDERVPRERAPINTRPSKTVTWATSRLALRGPWGPAEFAETN